MSLLTPSVQLPTNAPFPVYIQDEASEQQILQPSPDEKITIESCAEFMSFYMPGSKYGTSADFVLLHDLVGQPMVLSIGTDKRLNLCAFVNGGSGSWEIFDITPHPGFEALVCDASKSPDNKKILFAVSGYANGYKNATKVYQVVVDCPRLTADESGNVLPPFQHTAWVETGKAISNRQIDTLNCEYFGRQSQYRVIAGVAASTSEGSHYMYSPEGDSWSLIKFPQQVEKIRSCVPANFPALGPGYLVLFEDKNVTTDVSCFFQGNGVAKQIFLAGLENPRRIFASTSKTGITDILIAADNGIGYINTRHIAEKPPAILLQGIACSNVFASESATSPDESKVSVYALSTHGELYVIEGSRKVSNNNQIQFPNIMNFPIRDRIRNITGKINPVTDTFEIIYVTRDDDVLRHLARDSGTSLWVEFDMVVKSKRANNRVKTQAFFITITLKSNKGSPVIPGYQVQLESGPTLAYINERSYNLTWRPQVITTNNFGQLQVVIPAPESFCGNPIGIRFMPETGEGRVFVVQSAQRVFHRLGQLNTADALKNAVKSDNTPLFSQSMKEKHADTFETAAQVFSKVPSMLENVQSGQAPLSENSNEITLAWQKDESGARSSGEGWLSEASEAIGAVLGDMIEYLKKAVKGIVKIAMKIAGPVIRLILKIGAKIVRFVLDTASSIITGLTYLLEDLFDLDLSSLRDLFMFRYKKVEGTQKELASVITNGLLLTSRYLHHNHDLLDTAITSMGRFLEDHIARPYPKQPGSNQNSGLGGLFNNPIISNLMKYNPIGWTIEGVSEELGEDVKVPVLDLEIGSHLWRLLKDQFDLLLGLLKRSWGVFEAAIGQPDSLMEHLQLLFRESFWVIFDSIKSIVLEMYSMVMDSFDGIMKFCQGEWEIPFITDLWEELTGSKFTLINFVSYIAAQMLEISNFSSKPILEGLGVSSSLGNLEQKKIPQMVPQRFLDNLKAYEDATGGSFDALWESNMRQQTQGSADMALNPLTAPRFGLMAKLADAPKNEPTEYKNPIRPSTGALYGVAISRAGKSFARVANTSLEGFLQGGSQGGNNDGNGNGGSGNSGGGSLGNAKNDLRSRADDGLSLTDSSLAPSKGQTGAPSIKSMLIGVHAFGFSCRVIEGFLLLNNFDEESRDAENFDGLCIETAGALFGMITSLFADSPALFALSNFFVSATCFAGTMMAPSKTYNRISELAGSGAVTFSSILFVIKEPTCQTVAWVGVAIDFANLGVQIGYIFDYVRRSWQNEQLIPSEGTPAAIPKTDPKKQKPTTDVDRELIPSEGSPGAIPDTDPKQRKPTTAVVDRESQNRSMALHQRYGDIKTTQTLVEHQFGGHSSDPHPIHDFVGNARIALLYIVHREPWHVGKTYIRFAIENFKEKFYGDGGNYYRPFEERTMQYYQVDQNLPPGWTPLDYTQRTRDQIRLLEEIERDLNLLKDYIDTHWEEMA